MRWDLGYSLAVSLAYWLKTMNATASRSSVVPTLRYRDVDGAIAWLGAAFGFVVRDVVRAPDGQAISAQLTRDSGMIMLAAVGHSVFDDLMKQPDEVGGAETQSCYFVIDDCEAHYRRAVEHGAEIILDLQHFEKGGSGYLCRDFEGHLWSFGSLDPWGAKSQAGLSRLWANPALLKAREHVRALDPRMRIALTVLCGLIAGGAALAAALRDTGPSEDTTGSIGLARPSAIQLFKERGARLDTERKFERMEAEFVGAQHAKELADTELAKLQEQLEHLAGVKEQAEDSQHASDRKSADLHRELSRLQQAKAAAEKSLRLGVARGVHDRRQRQRHARQLATLRSELEAERQAKTRVEFTSKELKSDLDRETAAADAADVDRVKVQQMLAKERQANVDLQQAVDQLKKELEGLKTAEGAAPQSETQDEALKTFVPPRPAKRPEKRR